MYKFTPQQKAESKAYIRKLYAKFYGAKPEEKPTTTEPKNPSQPTAPKVSFYSDVKAWILKQSWQGKSTRALVAGYVEKEPTAFLPKVKQYVQRVIWELRKKSTAPTT